MTNKVAILNPIYTQDPQKAYLANKRKSLILKLATIINFFVITLLAFFFLSLITITAATIPIVHIAIGVVTPIVGVLFSSFLNGYKKCDLAAVFYDNVIKEKNNLKNQNKTLTKKYLDNIKCNPRSIETAIPAIAHFKAWEIKKRSSLAEIQKLKKNKTTNSNLKYTLQKQIHDIKENKFLRSKLKLAEIFYLIENPTSKKSLQDYGKIINLNFAKRHASKLSNDDVYFIFKDKIQKQKNKKCLTSTEINNLDICDISKLIFKN